MYSKLCLHLDGCSSFQHKQTRHSNKQNSPWAIPFAFKLQILVVRSPAPPPVWGWRGRRLKPEREWAKGATLRAGRLQVSAPTFQQHRYLDTTAPAWRFVSIRHFRQMGWSCLCILLQGHESVGHLEDSQSQQHKLCTNRSAVCVQLIVKITRQANTFRSWTDLSNWTSNFSFPLTPVLFRSVVNATGTLNCRSADRKCTGKHKPFLATAGLKSKNSKF